MSSLYEIARLRRKWYNTSYVSLLFITLDLRYAFRCHPKNRNGRHHLVAVNDIAFCPSMRGVIVTGDNEGYATIWDILNRKRLAELPRFPSSVASLAYNHGGQLLAVASSYTYQEDNERSKPCPQLNTSIWNVDVFCLYSFLWILSEPSSGPEYEDEMNEEEEDDIEA